MIRSARWVARHASVVRGSGLCAALVILASACGGGEDSAAVDEQDAGSEPEADGSVPDDAPGWITVDGETYSFTDVTRCDIGSDFWGADFRSFTATSSGGEYPGIHVGYAPPKADDEGVEDPNEVAFFPSSDPLYYATSAVGASDYEVTLLPDGAQGTATLAEVGGSGEEVEVEFAFTCAGSGGDASEPDPAEEESDEGATGGDDSASGGRTGYVVYDGTRSEFDSAEGDLDPQSGTGLCEVVDVTGQYGDDYFRISTNLDDGTPFLLEWDDGLILGETFAEVEVSDLAVAKDGRTVSGSASTENGPIEFSFTC